MSLILFEDFHSLLQNICLLSIAIYFVVFMTKDYLYDKKHAQSNTLRKSSMAPFFSLHIVRRNGNQMLVRRMKHDKNNNFDTLAPAVHASYASVADVELARRKLCTSLAVDPSDVSEAKFFSVIANTTRSVSSAASDQSLGALRFAADNASAQSFDWQFFVECDVDTPAPDGYQWIDARTLTRRAYDADVAHELALPLRLFGNPSFAPSADASLVDILRLIHKRNAPEIPTPLIDLRDFTLLDTCIYVFDRPGKGVRSRLVGALATHFAVPSDTLDRLQSFIEQFHQLSLMIDDIQDNSELRRNQPCAHVLFGVPETLGAAYLQLFRLFAEIPTAFPERTSAVTELVIDGCRVCQRGQAMDVTWRERRYCPSLAEWLEMAQGKTAAPFELAARLVFLQCGTVSRLQLTASLIAHKLLTRMGAMRAKQFFNFAGVLIGPIEETIVQLCGQIGVYFQIRDDYINLVDKEYWKTHGFCDDLHEKKFSYPIVLMVSERLPGYEKILSMYSNANDRSLNENEIRQALSVVQSSGALQRIADLLTSMKTDILNDAAALGMKDIAQLVQSLNIPSLTV